MSHGVRADYARLKILLYGNQYVWTPISYPTQRTFSAHLDIDYWSDYQLDFKVEIKTMDINGNIMSVTQTVSSAWFGLLKDVWNAIVEFFKAVKEKALEVLAGLVEWVVERVRGFVNMLVNTVKSVFSDVIDGYGLFLSALAGVVVGAGGAGASGVDVVGGGFGFGDKKDAVLGGSQPGGQRVFSLSSDILNAVLAFVDVMLKVYLVMFGTIMAGVGLFLALKAVTCGMEAVVETTIFGLAEDLVVASLIGVLASGLWDSIQELVDNEETDTQTFWDFISGYIGITVSYTATVIEIINTFIEYAKKKAFSWFILGLTLAISGYFLDAATTAMELTGNGLKTADAIGILLSLGGLLMMIVEKSSKGQQTLERTSPLLTMLEWVIAIGGLGKAIIDTLADKSSGWSG